MKKHFSYEQIISILCEAEAGVSARKQAISGVTFYSLRIKCGGLDVPAVKRFKSSEEGHGRLKKLLA